jgi:hypothetical protein
MKVFVSHIHEEASIAQVIKNAIEASFGEQLKVFCSSDPNDVPAGVNWLDQLQESLGKASALLVLCSKASQDRPWVNFETGYGRIKGIPVIPICHSGLSKGDLPIQIATIQALNVSDSDFGSRLINDLAVCLRLSEVPHIDEEAIRHDLEAVCSDLRERSRRVEVRVDDTFPDIGGTIVSFMPQPRPTDLIEEVACRLPLDLAKYGIQWCLRDQGGQYLKRDEGVIRNFCASTGLKQLLVLTIPPLHGVTKT